MTDKALTEAKAYIERSIEQQQKLGYKKPRRTAVRSAIKDTAKAVDSLLGLQARTTKTSLRSSRSLR